MCYHALGHEGLFVKLNKGRTGLIGLEVVDLVLFA
jgi:hypothetical protein